MPVIIGIAIFLDFLMIRIVGFSIFARCGIIIFAEKFAKITGVRKTTCIGNFRNG